MARVMARSIGTGEVRQWPGAKCSAIPACSQRRQLPYRTSSPVAREGPLSPSLWVIQAHSKRLLAQIGEAFQVVYFIFEGECGHNDALQMVRHPDERCVDGNAQGG